MKFLIFGGNGFLGTYLYRFLKKNHTVYRVTRKKGTGIYLKNFNHNEISCIINKFNPQIIINTIATTSVDNCELYQKKAYYSNVSITEMIVNSIKYNYNSKKKPFFVHISTDQVYSGKGPHKETKTRPINYYSKTKLLSENFVRDINGCVLRTNFIGNSTVPYNFNKWIYEHIKKNKKIFGYKNILFSPLAMDTLAKKIVIISRKKINGIYNLGSVGGVSKGQYISKFLNKNFPQFNKFELINYKKPTNKKKATRSLDMRMNCSKLINNHKFKLPNTSTEVNRIINNFKK